MNNFTKYASRLNPARFRTVQNYRSVFLTSSSSTSSWNVENPRSHLYRGCTAARRCWPRDDSAETPSLRNSRQQPIPRMYTPVPACPPFLFLATLDLLSLWRRAAAGPTLSGRPGNDAQLHREPPFAIDAVFFFYRTR